MVITSSCKGNSAGCCPYAKLELLQEGLVLHEIQCIEQGKCLNFGKNKGVTHEVYKRSLGVSIIERVSSI